MSEVTQDLLQEFGRAVQTARLGQGWTLNDLACQITPPPGTAFLAHLEQGKRTVGPATVARLITALTLPQDWTHRFAGTTPEPAETPADHLTDHLLHLHAQTPNAPEASPDLLLTLAADIAAGRHADPTTAYTDLSTALMAAADLKALGQFPQGISDQLTQTLRRVSALNDHGLRDEAGAEIDRAPAPPDDAQNALLTEIALAQDRIRNAPDAAAKRLLAHLRSVPQPGGLFRALHGTWEEWYDRGRDQRSAFDLNTALHLARANEDRSKGAQRVQALTDLGLTQFELGRVEGRNDRLKQSIASFRTVVASIKAKAEPDFWTAAMSNLAMALRELGARETSTALLEEAIKTARAALTLLDRKRSPQDWATTWANMAEAMSLLADRTNDLTLARQALQQSEEAAAVLPQADPEPIARAQAIITRLT